MKTDRSPPGKLEFRLYLNSNRVQKFTDQLKFKYISKELSMKILLLCYKRLKNIKKAGCCFYSLDFKHGKL